jgi:UDP-N-acetylglucosamine--N-acetylmuramyl-(pentapeptide) pyrophosphoryl-undecaprenol N-acetylglucosamine transferase
MKVLIAGGGTGGHLFPGIALAEELLTRHPNNEVVFVGTSRGLEARVVPQAGYPLELISTRGLKGMGFKQLMKSLLVLPWSFIQSWQILRRHKPDVVVGVGGYASGPLVMAAYLQRVPTAVQEQNAIPGLTNRILGKFARVVFVSFDEAKPYFPDGKAQLVGNPIRRKLLDNYLRSRAQTGKFGLLVFGGSQGARAINDRMMEALPHLADLKDELFVLHQTGKADGDRVREGYRRLGFKAEVVEFIDDMSSAYARADLVICRAGATTLAEITVCKKASLLIPFPFAADNHQEINAQALVKNGAAIMVREAELSGEKLAAEIRTLKQDPALLRRMERQAGLFGRPEAAKELADVCVRLMEDAYGPGGRGRTPRLTEGEAER